MSSVAIAEHSGDLVTALRRMNGRATVGDVVAATGLPRDKAEATLKQLLETHQGHLQVSESGELLYRFDPSLMVRGKQPLLGRIRKAAWEAFQVGFKVWTAAMLVVYFVVFAALLIAALTANRDNRAVGAVVGEAWAICSSGIGCSVAAAGGGEGCITGTDMQSASPRRPSHRSTKRCSRSSSAPTSLSRRSCRRTAAPCA
ncbi:MAG: hypothetical protein HKO53_19725 [Gemmatimonadetes bacterium]|nr:hypothetical protein [Gemmatimonadota bacterium]